MCGAGLSCGLRCGRTAAAAWGHGGLDNVPDGFRAGDDGATLLGVEPVDLLAGEPDVEGDHVRSYGFGSVADTETDGVGFGG